MGRHTDAAAVTGRRQGTLIAVGLLLLALVAWVLWGIVGGDDTVAGGDDPSASAPTTQDAAEATEAATSEAAPAATTDAPTTDAATSTSEAEQTSEEPEQAGPSEALVACASEVAAGDELAAVASVGASNWKAHYMASVDYNAGRISVDEANAIFAETKPNVEQEVADYEAARAAYDEATGGCAELAQAPAAGEFADAAAGCEARAAALTQLAATADKVNNDWAEHGAMMASKAEQDINEYMAEWHHDVATAPENMQPYEDAVAELEAAPTCSVD